MLEQIRLCGRRINAKWHQFSDVISRDVRQFLWLQLMEPPTIDSTFAKKVGSRNRLSNDFTFNCSTTSSSRNEIS